jgi:hypothetical protein
MFGVKRPFLIAVFAQHLKVIQQRVIKNKNQRKKFTK